MVQFYNTYCGHCQMFAPIYKDLASRLKNWTSVVRVAGVDCSREENVITCSDNKIKGYPTILVFPPNARVQDPKTAPLDLRSLNIEWNIDGIEEALVDYLTNLTKTQLEYPLVVNALQPVKNLRTIHRIYPAPKEHDIESVGGYHGIQDLMFLVESEKSYLGRKLILEYFRISSKLELRRILLTNKTLLKSILPDGEYAKLEASQPLLIRLNEGNKAQVLVRGEANHILPTSPEHERQDFIHDRFKTFFEHFYSVELKEHSGDSETKSYFKKKPKAPPTSANEIDTKNNEELEIQHLLQNDPLNGKRVFAVDILKGISYMITHEIKIKGDLSPTEFNTVRNLLTILQKYLPLEKWDSGIGKFIADLRTRLDDKRHTYDKNGLSAQEMRDLLELSGADAVRLRYSRENWVSCLESDRQQKGYTCSLWLLFHSLTVGEYLKAAPVRIKPTLVLFTMRDYVTTFLGCTVCSSNYKKETESLEGSLTARNSSVLWLWRTHNYINQRLNNEKQKEKQSLINVLFPSYSRCPKCIKSDISEIGVDGKTIADVDWNETNVLEYLISTYRPDKSVSPMEMASLISNIRSKVNYDLIDGSNKIDIGGGGLSSAAKLNRSIEQSNNQSIFSTSDISLCLLLYIACIMIVAIVCVALNPKWIRFRNK